MTWVIKLEEFVGRADVEHSELAMSHVGRFVSSYAPFSDDPEQLLQTVDDPREARKFTSPTAAFDCWNQIVGIRPDGRPDRPPAGYTLDDTARDRRPFRKEWLSRFDSQPRARVVAMRRSRVTTRKTA